MRLVTRGQGSLVAAHFVFAAALFRILFARVTGKIDVLHIHLSDRGSCYRKVLLGYAAQLLSVPYVIHLHGAIFLEYWSSAPIWIARSVDHLFRHSRRIIVLGQYWAQGISDRLPNVKGKILVLPNATPSMNSQHLASVDGRIRITFLGQLSKRKGSPELIAALQSLAYRLDWVATLAGDGTVEESRATVRSATMESRIKIPGWLDESETANLLDQTDILVLPSRAENLPMAILEGFARGIAVIATPVGAIPEVIKHGRNGLIVPAGDVPALAEALALLISDAELRRRLGDAARKDHTARYEMTSYVSHLIGEWRGASLTTAGADPAGPK